MYRAIALAALPWAFAAPAASSQTTQVVEKYIVMFHAPTGLHRRGATILQTPLFSSLHTTQQYNSQGINGFAASLTPAQVEALSADPAVAYVERDGFLTPQVIPKAAQGPRKDFGTKDVAPINVQTQTNSTWGLARLSHRGVNNTEYRYDSSAGEGTCAYVIDTGVMIAHDEFEGRAILLKAYKTGDNSDDDLFGHGTHVAGTIGSKTYGVAKKTTILALKVCNELGMCQVSDIVAAMLLAVEDSKTRAACSKGSVVNISLGAPNTDWKSLKDTVKVVTDAGVFFASAAGNQAKNAVSYSPASAPESCTIGATDLADNMAPFSNYGANVAVFAPGVDVLSTSPLGKNATFVLSGTSMASPHIAGLAAYFLGLPGATKLPPAELCQLIKDKSIKDIVTDIPKDTGTVNRLANNGML